MADEKQEELTTEKAKLLLEKERQEKILNCQKEVRAVLDKYGCELDALMVLRAGQVIPQIEIRIKQ